MTALTHRQLALKLAVENANAIEMDLTDDVTYDAVIVVSNKFAAYLNGDDAATTTASAEATPEPARQRTARDAVDAILNGVTLQADRLGADLVETVQREAGRLRSLGSFSAVTDAALEIIRQNSNSIGATAADRLRRIVRDAR